MPEVSVVIPAYNAEKYIAEAIDSVLAQSFSDYEIIAVDDGSTDRTAAIIKSYPEVKYVFQEHTGISAARNRAINDAGGRYIAFLDADDLWKKDKLEKQVTYLNEHRDIMVLYSRFRNFTDIDEKDLSLRQQETLKIEDIDHLTTALVRKEFFNTVGLFSTGLEYAEDTEWTLRVKLKYQKESETLEDCLYLRRIHDSNITLSHDDTNLSQFLIMAARVAMRYRRREKDESISIDTDV